MPEDNGKQNPEESYTNNYQRHIASIYGYKLLCVDDKFSKLFKIYLGKDAVYMFIDIMIEVSKYCSEVMKKSFNKKFVMIKEELNSSQNFCRVTQLILL